MNWGITCFFEDKKDFEIVAKLAPNFPLKYIEIRGERPFFSPEDLTNDDSSDIVDQICREMEEDMYVATDTDDYDDYDESNHGGKNKHRHK